METGIPNTRMSIATAAAILSIAASTSSTRLTAHAFVSPPPFSSKYATRRLTPPALMPTRMLYPNKCPWRSRDILHMSATASDEDMKEEISAMSAKEIRQELESYGISTKSIFEKSEMVEALVKARKEGKTPVGNEVKGDADTTNSGTSSGSSNSSTSASNRNKRIRKEMEKCKKLKVGELKKELESYGISTKSYFEKSEFVRAVAEARVDGPKNSASWSGTGSTTNSGRVQEEPRDPSYRDVVVSKFGGGKGLLGGGVIDVKAR